MSCIYDDDENLHPDLPLLKRGIVYKISKNLSVKQDEAVLRCIEAECSNVFNSFEILQITCGLENYTLHQTVRWRRDWFYYNELSKEDYPEYYL